MAAPLLRFHSKLAELRGMKPLTEPPPRYAEWIDFCFGRLQRLGAGADIRDKRLRHDTIEVTDVELVALFEVTMRRSGTDLAPFDDEVVGGGLSLILNGALSDFGNRVRSAPVAIERKVNAIWSLKSLYDDILTPRAQPRLGHLSEIGHDRLSSICYMLWDVTGLAYWSERDEADAVPQAILSVLEHALLSPNDAVIESGLHGLGHRASPARRKAAIQHLLELRPGLRPELRTYAEAAALGHVL
jgi:hypothetical protein